MFYICHIQACHTLHKPSTPTDSSASSSFFSPSPAPSVALPGKKRKTKDTTKVQATIQPPWQLSLAPFALSDSEESRVFTARGPNPSRGGCVARQNAKAIAVCCLLPFVPCGLHCPCHRPLALLPTRGCVLPVYVCVYLSYTPHSLNLSRSSFVTVRNTPQTPKVQKDSFQRHGMKGDFQQSPFIPCRLKVVFIDFWYLRCVPPLFLSLSHSFSLYVLFCTCCVHVCLPAFLPLPLFLCVYLRHFRNR